MLSTLAKVKAHLGETVLSDALLSTWLAAIDARVKRYLRQNVETATYVEYPRCLGNKWIRLRESPVQSITSVYVDPTFVFAAASLLTDGTDYTVINNRLYRIDGTWPRNIVRRRGDLAASSEPSEGAVKVTYVAGYDDVPADVTLAVNLIVARLAIVARTGGQSMQSQSLEDYSYTLAGLPESQGEDQLLGPVLPMLKPFRRRLT